MGDWATEGGHWYGRDGSPCYEVTAKNGNLRPTTLRDARKMNLVPSVTMIIKEAAAPGLEKWKRDQLLMAALTLPRLEGEEESSWLARVYLDSQEQGKKAAERGSDIHGAIESWVRVGPQSHAFEDWVHVAVLVLDAYQPIRTKWREERSFAHPSGYGGRIDLHCDEWLVDIKTKDGLDRIELYDEHLMQLAAYRRGIGLPKAKAGILFVDRNEPKAAFIEANEEQLERGLFMFDSLLSYFRWRTEYDPAWKD